MNQKFSYPGSVSSWECMVVCMPGQVDAFPTSKALDETLKNLCNVLKSTGIKIEPTAQRKKVTLVDENDGTIDRELEISSKSSSFLFIVLPSDRMQLYDRIKYLCDVKLGLATICSVGTKLAKNEDQYFRNLALKFNLKLGGHNQEVRTQLPSIIDTDRTMVVGIDVTHPSPGSTENAPSVAGMVANIDKRMGQWPAVLSVQSEARQEMGK